VACDINDAPEQHFVAKEAYCQPILASKGPFGRLKGKVFKKQDYSNIINNVTFRTRSQMTRQGEKYHIFWALGCYQSFEFVGYFPSCFMSSHHRFTFFFILCKNAESVTNLLPAL